MALETPRDPGPSLELCVFIQVPPAMAQVGKSDLLLGIATVSPQGASRCLLATAVARLLPRETLESCREVLFPTEGVLCSSRVLVTAVEMLL